MFRSTPPALFHQIPALLRFKLHQPIPLNPRESKQLLDLLTTSFRQHLDHEHGAPIPSDAEPKINPTLPVKQVESVKPRRHSHSGPRHADKHIQSILTNPLFHQTPKDHDHNRRDIIDPMVTFDRAVGRGMMTLTSAKACLQAKRNQLARIPNGHSLESVRDTGAGLKVLKWLNASGISNNNEFLQDKSFVHVLFEFLQAEGLDGAIWTWINRAIHEVHEKKQNPLQLADWIHALVHNTIHQSKPVSPNWLESCITILRKVAATTEEMRISDRRAILVRAGHALYGRIVANSPRMPDAVSVEVFEAFRQIVGIIDSQNSVYVHGLDVYHPSRPSADECLRYFRESREPVHTSESLAGSSPKLVIQISLAVARLLLNQDRVEDARWVIQYLSAKHPKELGIREPSEHRTAKLVDHEESNIQFLESLSMT